MSHWFVSQASDHYELPEDGLPRHEITLRNRAEPLTVLVVRSAASLISMARPVLGENPGG